VGGQGISFYSIESILKSCLLHCLPVNIGYKVPSHLYIEYRTMEYLLIASLRSLAVFKWGGGFLVTFGDVRLEVDTQVVANKMDFEAPFVLSIQGQEARAFARQHQDRSLFRMHHSGRHKCVNDYSWASPPVCCVT